MPLVSSGLGQPSDAFSWQALGLGQRRATVRVQGWSLHSEVWNTLLASGCLGSFVLLPGFVLGSLSLLGGFQGIVNWSLTAWNRAGVLKRLYTGYSTTHRGTV